MAVRVTLLGNESLSCLNLWPDSPEAGKILLGKRVLIVVRVSLSVGSMPHSSVPRSLQDEVDDSRMTLQYVLLVVRPFQLC